MKEKNEMKKKECSSEICSELDNAECGMEVVCLNLYSKCDTEIENVMSSMLKVMCNRSVEYCC